MNTRTSKRIISQIKQGGYSIKSKLDLKVLKIVSFSSSRFLTKAKSVRKWRDYLEEDLSIFQLSSQYLTKAE